MTAAKDPALRTAEILIDVQSPGNDMGFGRVKTYASMFSVNNLKTKQTKLTMPSKMGGAPHGLLNARN